jgi:dihydrofolate reductase
VVYGHGAVGAELLAEGLLDELRLWIHPVVLGTGRPFFADGVRAGLALADVRTTATGVVIVTFHPARR